MSAHERPWVSWIWRISVLLFIVAISGVWAGRRGVREPAVAGGSELSTNTLAEAHLDYDAMLEDINGDFGIRSEVVEAAGQEPEYRGSETLVVPLYIPDGALPISLARIARSGDQQQPTVELLDMEMSPSADSILIRRIGPVNGRRKRPPPPGRAAWRTPQRARISRLTPIRRSDLAGRRPVPPPPVPVAPLARFGQRLSAPSLVAVRRVALSQATPDHGDDSGGGGGDDEALDDSSTKRAKKNEFSKDSQFPDELHTTTGPEAVGQAPSAPPDTSATSTVRTSTAAAERGDKRNTTRKFLKPLPLLTTTRTPPTTTTPSSTTPHTTRKPKATTSPTTPPTTIAPTPKTPSTTTSSPSTTTTSSSTTTSPTTTSTTATVPTTSTSTSTTPPSTTTRSSTTVTSSSTTAPTTTERTSITAKPIVRRKILRDSSPQEKPTTSTTSAPATTKWDRRSVLFLRPVESILKATTTEKSTTTSTSTTTAAPTITTTTTKTTTTTTTSRSPSAHLRILPPWLTRSKSTTTTRRTPTATQSTTTTTTTTPVTTRPPVVTERPTVFGRLRVAVTKRPLNTTTEKPKLKATRRLSPTTEVPLPGLTTTTRSPVTLRTASTTTDQTTVPTTTASSAAPTRSSVATTRSSVATTTRSVATTRSSVATTKRPPAITRGPVISLDRSSPMRRMPSVSEILRDAPAPEDQEGSQEPVETTTSLSSSTAKSPSADEMLKKVTSESSFINEERVKNSTSRPEKERESKPPVRWFLGGDRNNAKQETTTEESQHELTVPGLRKFMRRPWPTPTNSEPHVHPGGRPVGHRRRRPLRPRITIPPPITHTRDFFTPPEETISLRWTTEDQKTTVIVTSSTTPPTVVSTTLPTPTATTSKSPEQVVIESLTEIMREATNNNKSKDKVSSIASNLEALNKQLAEQGIHIIHAEIDGVKIKLDNRTITRPILLPVATTFRPSAVPEISASDSSTTEKPTTSIAPPPTGDGESSIPDGTEDSKPVKQIFTSVKSSFSFHTSKQSELEEEIDIDNKVQSTTDESGFTTTKPVESRKFTDKPVQGESSRPTLSSSLLPSVDEADEDPARNKTQPDGSSKTPVVDEASSTVRTSTPRKDRDKEGDQDGTVTSVAIFATSTVPASVTTRTRSTTVPITTHRPATTPFLHNPFGSQSGFVGFTRGDTTALGSTETRPDDLVTEDPAFDIPVSRNKSLAPQFPYIPFSIHPTAHHRPTSLPPLTERGPADVSSADATSVATTSKLLTSTESTEENSASTVETTAARTTTQRPIIEVISITREIQDSPFAPGSAATVENIESEDFADSSSSTTSYTASYVVGVIGIIPAAGLAAFLARKFLKKTQKALPESEEPAEGFTPVTHHSRKPSHSNTLDVDGSSVEAKNPKYTPWEFPRSKLRLVSILGEGNFGVVWKAEARELCACEGAPGGPTVLVAVKGVKEGAGVKERQDLLRELAIMQHLGQHPNVVTLLGCCTQQEPHYVIMEYVMFGKLLTFLRDHRTRHNYYNFSSDTEALTSRDLTRFACQVATGCEYLQGRGIIHRDLASRNILVDHNKLCKIADFGLARNVKDLGSDIYEQKSRGALPIRWMAPESLYMNIFTHKSDVWSFGILCWEIVTLGSTPYPGMTAREVMRRVREGYRLERPDHCHPELYRVVTKCWHQDLNKRPSFTEVKKDLTQLLDQGQTGYIDLENFPEANYFSMHENNDEKL